MTMVKRFKSWGLAALLGLASLGAAHAQPAAPFPSQPIKLVLSYPPGGVMDPVARLLAPYLTQGLG